MNQTDTEKRLNSLRAEREGQADPVEQRRLDVEIARIFRDLSGKNPGKYLESCVTHCRKALVEISKSDDPIHWADLKECLGIVLGNRFQGDRSENLENAIANLKNAAELYDRDKHPVQWANVQNALGDVFRKRIKGVPANNLERSIGYHQAASEVFTRKSHPEKWATTQHSLGNGYLCNRIHGHFPDNLEKALEYYSNALMIRTVDSCPVEWAATQNNLGLTYRYRFQGDPAQNLERAIMHYNQALTVCTRESVPFDWADTLTNLGSIFRDRIYGDREMNQEKAIDCCTQALELFTMNEYPTKFAETILVLGHVYEARWTDGRDLNLHKARECYKAAQTVFTRAFYPIAWAMIQNGLGLTLIGLEQPLDKKQQEKANDHLDSALEIYSQNNMSNNWADTNVNKGRGCLKFSGNSDPTLLDQAVDCFTNALSVHNRESSPTMTKYVALKLSNTHIARRDYSQALKTLGLAKLADVHTLQKAVLEKSIKREIDLGSNLYYSAAFCLAKLGRSRESLEWLDQGKTRSLAEKFALDRADFHKISISDKDRYRKLVAHLNALEDEQKNPQRDLVQITGDVRKTRGDLGHLIQDIRTYCPDFIKRGITYANMAALVPDDSTRVVVFNFTEHGTVIFLMGIQSGEHTLQTRIIDNFKIADLINFQKIWLQRYNEFASSSRDTYECSTWGTFVSRFMERLSDALIQPFESDLYDQSIRKLILIPHLSLHIFPLNHLSCTRNEVRNLLMDNFTISTTPSLTILHHNSQRTGTTKGTWIGIANPTFDLSFSEDEVEKIRALRDETATLLTGFQATYDEVIQSIQDKGYIHFACHGRFDIKDPYRAYLALAATPQDLKLLDRVNPLEGPLIETTRDSADNNYSRTYLLEDDIRKIVYLDTSGAETSVLYVCPNGQTFNKELNARLLTLSDIFNSLKLSGNRLVALSVCESGLVPPTVRADEFIGLPAGFLYAGAGAVLSTLWAINDESTQIFMERFYRNVWHEKMPFPVALRKAQQEMRSDPRYGNPFYWAAFQITGLG